MKEFKTQDNVTVFQPTWLYVKTHNQTGLKYFGKTCEEDPDKYTGSGTHWTRHIKKHGYDVTTEIVGYYTDKEECVRTALFLSDLWDIVASKDWANLQIEDGLTGGSKGRKVSAATRQKLREQNLLRVVARTHNLLKQADGTSVGQETSLARSAAGLIIPTWLMKRADGSSWMSDRTALGLNPFSGESGSEISRKHNQDMLDNGTHPSQLKKNCPFCNKEVNLSSYVKYHNERCKENPDRVEYTPRVKKECPHCLGWFDGGNYAKSHGDHCKMKPVGEMSK